MSALHPRGTSNTNSRGSSKRRRERRLWLIANWYDWSSWGIQPEPDIERSSNHG